MILVTGSTGHFGDAVINFLLRKMPSAQIVALIREEQKAKGLQEKGVLTRVGNYHDYNSLVGAFHGIDKLLLISSSEFNDRAGQHMNVINAASEAGVKHIVYTGVSIKDINHSVIPVIINDHAKTEDYIKKSGLTHTLLNNTIYADMLPSWFGANVLKTGVLFPSGVGRVPFTTRLDMAEAASNVLTTEGHENKEYPISAGTSYSMGDIAQRLSELAGQPVAHVDIPKDVFIDNLVSSGMPPQYAQVIAAFAEAIGLGEFDLPDNTLQKLLGRKPMSVEQYLKTIYFRDLL